MTCDQQFCTFTYVLQSRAPGGIGKRGTCPALGIYTRLIQLQHFVSDKKYQNRYHKTRSWFKIYASCSHRPRAVLKRFAPQQRREGRVERAGGKGRGGKGGEEWRDRGRNRLCHLLQEFLRAPMIATRHCTVHQLTGDKTALYVTDSKSTFTTQRSCHCRT